MRVKISAKEYGIEKLEFGKEYYLAYAGITYGESFVFTRKNKVELRDIENGRKVAAYWISKKKLKQLIHNGDFHWMGDYSQTDS